MNFIISWRLITVVCIYHYTQSFSSTAACHPDNLTVDAMLNISLSRLLCDWLTLLRTQSLIQQQSSMWLGVSCWLYLLKGEIITNRDSHQGYTLKNVFHIIQKKKNLSYHFTMFQIFHGHFSTVKLEKNISSKKNNHRKMLTLIPTFFCCFCFVICFLKLVVGHLKNFCSMYFYINKTAKRIINMKNERNPVDSIIIL